LDSLVAFLRSLLPRKAYSFLQRALMPAYRAYFVVLYYGNRFLCPCCGKRCRRFIPRNRSLRAFNYGRCPHCFLYGRHRLLWLFLRDHTGLFSDSLKVLHVAPEPFFARAFSAPPHLDYVSLDLEKPVMLRMDVTELGFGDETFNTIICVHVLEQIVDDRKAMRELFTVLKPDGWAILQSPIEREFTYEDTSVTSPSDRKKAFGQWDYGRSYGRDYFDCLEDAGFEVREYPYAAEIPPQQLREFGLPSEAMIHLCAKPGSTGPSNEVGAVGSGRDRDGR
jgi:SAM-dependent methyltransferase